MKSADYYQDRIKNYLGRHGYGAMNLKAVFFDMDGVLFDSMPWHARTWVEVMTAHGLPFTKEDAYMNEGRTGAGTIDLTMRKYLGRGATEEEIKSIYSEKTGAFCELPEAAPMPGALELVEKMHRDGLMTSVVTGSAQKSLIDRIEHSYKSLFCHKCMVSAFDVKKGKPAPEPYLMALQKTGTEPWQGMVVENAPLGVEAGSKAGIFTVAVNTGPLADSVLWDAGADIVFSSMQELADSWETLFMSMKDCKGTAHVE